VFKCLKAFDDIFAFSNRVKPLCDIYYFSSSSLKSKAHLSAQTKSSSPSSPPSTLETKINFDKPPTYKNEKFITIIARGYFLVADAM
jgi:hypothetical protein